MNLPFGSTPNTVFIDDWSASDIKSERVTSAVGFGGGEANADMALTAVQ